MFASQTTRDLTFGEHTVTIGKLSALHIEEARLARMKAVAPLLADLSAVTAARAAEDAPPNRKTMFDRLTVLRRGIRSWSVSEKVAVDQIADLDEPTADALFEGILELTFESEDARKKDS